MKRVAIIGAGPAGLMAAEAALARGAQVSIYDAMPSPARKFLMAGKSGLNITHSEDESLFRSRYTAPDGRLAAMIDAFGPAEIVAWMKGLGIETYAGSSGRVFPVGMKASPLLRAWLARLSAGGATLHTRHRWTGWDRSGRLCFRAPEGEVTVEADAAILALGGASWSRLGSDGGWAPLLAARGVEIEPFGAANCGFHIPWSDHMLKAHEGASIKGVRLSAFGQESRGDFVITKRGLEGGALYPLAASLAAAARRGDPQTLMIDLLPDAGEADLASRLASSPAKESLSNRLRKAARLPPPKIALFQELFRGNAMRDPAQIASTLKAFPLRLHGPAPLDTAISTSGGVSWSALDDTLMLRDIPGTYCVGEMVAWDAPTGGYLLTACLAMGRAVGARI
ncbi:TIGR03862 family flavoprotein [Hyphomonas sp. WL0036]|uniref:TIGR03862 family flavoprotein n=1 Tax=Hyphomonas sediminis TaxID=2866160 RepID=UPI001C7FFA9C|nr:TIGR03862 family flavoprotein [Hyphomonas sediminis]MBY9065313.1 TIGR03862 family flavoprotein [Hyphomonas sediminis]